MTTWCPATEKRIKKYTRRNDQKRLFLCVVAAKHNRNRVICARGNSHDIKRQQQQSSSTINACSGIESFNRERCVSLYHPLEIECNKHPLFMIDEKLPVVPRVFNIVSLVCTNIRDSRAFVGGVLCSRVSVYTLRETMKIYG